MSSALSPKDRIIVAVDTDDLVVAQDIVGELRDHVGAFKFGLEFWTNLLARLLFERSATRGDDATLCEARSLMMTVEGRLMTDLKFKDIPNTMAGAARGAAALGSSFFTVHASAGVKGMRAAVENAGTAKVLAVTVLTSMNDKECFVSYGGEVSNAVRDFAGMAMEAGVHGIVCAPSDVAGIRAVCPKWDPEFVCPGIRPVWAATGDQNKDRAMTPAEAIRAGATRMVIGRPITRPPSQFANRREAAIAIAEEIAAALA